MKQVRFVPNVDCGLKVREDENGQQSRVVEGRAIVFGQRSVNLTPWSSTRVVYEILERGCLTQDLINRSDVVYCLNHNSGVLTVFGRFRNTDAAFFYKNGYAVFFMLTQLNRAFIYLY